MCCFSAPIATFVHFLDSGCPDGAYFHCSPSPWPFGCPAHLPIASCHSSPSSWLPSLVRTKSNWQWSSGHAFYFWLALPFLIFLCLLLWRFWVRSYTCLEPIWAWGHCFRLRFFGFLPGQSSKANPFDRSRCFRSGAKLAAWDRCWISRLWLRCRCCWICWWLFCFDWGYVSSICREPLRLLLSDPPWPQFLESQVLDGGFSMFASSSAGSSTYSFHFVAPQSQPLLHLDCDIEPQSPQPCHSTSWS